MTHDYQVSNLTIPCISIYTIPGFLGSRDGKHIHDAKEHIQKLCGVQITAAIRTTNDQQAMGINQGCLGEMNLEYSASTN